MLYVNYTTSVAVNVSNCDVSVVCDVGTETPEVVAGEDAPDDVDKIPVTGTEVDATALAQEQEQDPTLVTCWAQAQAGKGGFVVHKELLYHRDQVEGQNVCQLCVPQGRRDSILRLAHESVFGGHLGERKTGERGSGCHFTGPDCVSLCWGMYSRVVTVS